MALTLLAANNAQTVLAAGISASATSLTVNSGTGSLFPAPSAGVSFFKLTLIDAATGQLTEIMHVTARTGDTMTIERGQEGTTARAWSANDIAANMMTAGTLSYLLTNFQPLDPTLTAIAALVGAANKLPYFNGVDSAALTDLTAVGRDIIGKSTIADVLTYLTAAPLASPSFTGTPTVPNAPAGTNTTQSANTAFVTAALTAFLPKRSFANKDYIRIPDVAGGLIIQWGVESVPASSSTVFSLPTTFTNAGLVAVASAADSTTTTNYRASAGSISPFPTASQIRLTNTYPSNAINVFYIAIGY